MDNINKTTDVLKQLGYDAKIDSGKRLIYFTSFGYEHFKKEHKEIVKTLLGTQLNEFYYGGNNIQYIYYYNH